MPLTRRLLVAAATALAWALVMLAMLWPVFVDTLPLALFAGAGAFLSGLVFAPLFGQPDWRGIALAVFGSVAATLLGAGLGGFAVGMLGGPTIAGLWPGPIVVAQAIAMTPGVLVAWVTTMTAVHLVALRAHQPRLLPS
jgi:hypothetical protein